MTTRIKKKQYAEWHIKYTSDTTIRQIGVK